MDVHRHHLRTAVRTALLGQGAVRWLSPALRRRFGVAMFAWGLAGGAAAALLGLERGHLPVALLVAVLFAVPFFAYDVMLSYLLLERRERAGEMAVAARIQAGLLPDSVPRHDLWECSGRNRPAREVGGDLWEALVLPDGRWLLVVADVSGKGVPAAILMSGLRARLHLLAEQDPDPGRLATRLNEALAAETEPTEFATLLLVLLDPAGTELTYVNAGHPPGLLCRADGGEVVPLEADGIPVGMLEGVDYASRPAAWRPGDGLLLYSDGVTEAAVERHGPLATARLVEAVRGERAGSAAGMVDAVLDLVDAVTGGGEAEDDVTVVACRFRAEPPGR